MAAIFTSPKAPPPGPWEGLLTAADEAADKEEVMADSVSQEDAEFNSMKCPSMQTEALQQQRVAGLNVPLVKTPEGVSSNILALAGATERDLFLDLGCGDGRLVTQAADQTGALGAGFDVNDTLLRLCRRRANDHFLSGQSGGRDSEGSGSGGGGRATPAEDRGCLRQRVRFLKRNFMEMADDPIFKACTIIFMYLLPPTLAELEPLLFEALESRPNLRLITFMHHFEGREAQKQDLFGVLRLYGWDGSSPTTAASSAAADEPCAATRSSPEEADG